MVEAEGSRRKVAKKSFEIWSKNIAVNIVALMGEKRNALATQ